MARLLMHLDVASRSLVQDILLLLVSVVTIYVLYKQLWQRTGIPEGLRQIPGPPPNLLGHHAGQFDPVAPFMAFQWWVQEYGSLFAVKLGSQHIISLNNPLLAKELFEKRGTNYSSRKAPHVGYDLLSQGRRIGFTPSGAKHKAYRKQIQGILSITRTRENQKYQELESRQLLREILEWSENPTPAYDHVQDVVRRYTASVMTTLAFGHKVTALNDDFVKTIFAIMDDFSDVCQPGRYYVDIFPVLKKLPRVLRFWESEVNNKIKWQWAFLYRLLCRVERQMANGVANAGLIRALVEERKDMSDQDRDLNFLDDRSIGYQAMTIMEAGSDTTANTLTNFILAMVIHPDVMRKGQDCVDSFSSEAQLPSFDDIAQMHYVLQLVKETLRWRPTVLMGVPHANINADEVDGFYIPADSVIYGNIWHMNHDPTHYSNPDDFNPERYIKLTKSAFESSNEPNPLDRDNYTFGWGRRICPGMHLAEKSLLLVVARTLWAYDIVHATDGAGNRIPISADPIEAYDNNVMASVKPFPVKFLLRSEKRGQVIRDSYRDALASWERMNLDLFRD